MPQTLKEYGLEEKAYKYSVITGWSDVVGEKVAAVTLPEKLDRGVLTVRVTNAVWKYELTMRKAEILRKIRAKFGELSVSDIHWK
jgi:predicted nucleic acid-binding Zn ribbon protein